MAKKLILNVEETKFYSYKNLELSPIKINKLVKILILSMLLKGNENEKSTANKLIELINVRKNSYSIFSTNINNTSLDKLLIQKYSLDIELDKNNIKTLNFNDIKSIKDINYNDFLNFFLLSHNITNLKSIDDFFQKINIETPTITNLDKDIITQNYLNKLIKQEKSPYYDYFSIFNNSDINGKNDNIYFKSHNIKYFYLFENITYLLEEFRKIPEIKDINELTDKSLVLQSKIKNSSYSKYLPLFETLLNFAKKNSDYSNIPLLSIKNDKNKYSFLNLEKEIYIKNLEKVINNIKENIIKLNNIDNKIDYKNIKIIDFHDYLMNKNESLYLDSKDLFYVVARDKFHNKNFDKDGILSITNCGDKLKAYISYDFKTALPMNNALLTLILNSNYQYEIKGKMYIENKITNIEAEKDSELIKKIEAKIEHKNLSKLYNHEDSKEKLIIKRKSNKL